MEKKMRRFRQALPKDVCEEILRRGTSGVLALCGEDGPYAVPMSYVWADGRIIFHCARQGHKLDCIRYDDRCSFSVVDQDQVVPERYTTYFRSVIAFGHIRVVEDPVEMRTMTEQLGEKYNPGHPTELTAEIDGALSHLCVLVMDVTRLTGKEARELMEQRRKEP